MPSNIIQINHAKSQEWYVNDSNMDLLIIYLDKIGTRVEGGKRTDNAKTEDS